MSQRNPTGRISHTVALQQALALIFDIRDCVDRLAIAGSLRRGRSDVKDIELVARPKYDGTVNRLEDRLEAFWQLGVIRPRLNRADRPIAWGHPDKDSRFKAFTFIRKAHIPVDLFIVLPDRQWGPTMVIRTGPGEANEALVTQQGKRNRNGDTGILPADMRFAEGAVWRGDMEMVTPEETDVFSAAGLPWIVPFERSTWAYHNPGRTSRISETYGSVWRDGAQIDLPDWLLELAQPREFSRPVTQMSLF